MITAPRASRLLPMSAVRRRPDGVREERELLPPLQAPPALRADRAAAIRIRHQQEPPEPRRVRQLREPAERAAAPATLGGREWHGPEHPPALPATKVFVRHFFSEEEDEDDEEDDAAGVEVDVEAPDELPEADDDLSPEPEPEPEEPDPEPESEEELDESFFFDP